MTSTQERGVLNALTGSCQDLDVVASRKEAARRIPSSRKEPGKMWLDSHFIFHSILEMQAQQCTLTSISLSFVAWPWQLAVHRLPLRTTRSTFVGMHSASVIR